MQKTSAVNCLFAILMLIFSSTLYAQQGQQSEQAQAGAENNKQDVAEAGNEAELPADSQRPNQERPNQELPNIDTQPIPAGSAGPGRFIPSEQISQDLGVSFPVDI